VETARKLSEAAGLRGAAQGRLEARLGQRRMLLYSAGLAGACGAPSIVMWLGYRKRRRQRLFEQVLQIEKDLRGVIRHEIRARWQNQWDRLGTEKDIAGRFPYSYLKKKLGKEEHARDVLEVSNFGHLVAIVDTAWESLGFAERALPKTKDLVVAALSYLGTCRNAFAHSAELQHELGVGPGRVDPTVHMDRQVRQSLSTIRENLDLRLPSAPAPASAPGARHSGRPMTIVDVDAELEPGESQA
jgi:hypothetical protein